MIIKNTLILNEDGADLSILTRLLAEKDIAAVVESREILYENGKPFDAAKFDSLIYSGKTVNFVEKAMEFAVNAKIKRAILIGSALSCFDRIFPDKKLAETHNYIRQANLCAETALSFADKISISIVELPFLEGEWPPEFNTVLGVVGFDCKRFFFAPDGGTAEITAENAAKAIYICLINGKNGVKYPICDKSRKYKAILSEKAGETAKVYDYPVEFARLTALLKGRELKKQGLTPDFDLYGLYSDLLLQNLYFNADGVKGSLKYDETDI